MLDHELMTHDENRGRMGPQQVVHAHEGFEKIDDQVGLNRFDGFADGAKAAAEAGQLADETGSRRCHRDGPAFVERESGTGDPANRDGKSLLKECRQAAGLIRTHQHGRHAMPPPLEHLAHRDRLRHVSPPLALDCEHHFHEIG